MPRRRLPHPGPQGHAAAASRASTSRWKRSSTTSSSSPRDSACRPARPTSRSSRHAARSVATSCRDGTGKPVRLHIRGPSFYNLQSMGAMVPGTLRGRRGGDHLEHRPDHGRGRPLMAFNDSEPQARRPSSSRATRTRSRRSSRCCTSRRTSDGWVTPEAMRRDRGAARPHARARSSGRAPSTRCSSASRWATCSCPCARTCRAS